MSDMPTAEELSARIAARARASEEAVEAALAAAGVSLDPPLPAQRSLLVHRVYVRGVKAGTEAGANGPFERDIPLGPGTWAIASDINLAGKSSMLWALTWPLRGQPDDAYQRSDTSRWFEYLRVDAEVARVPMSFRVRLENGVLHEGTLLTADSNGHLTALEGDGQSGRGVRTVTSVASQEAYAATVDRLMLERLGLAPLHLFSAVPGAPHEEDGSRDGSRQVHGWPAYFSVIALASASDSILFGHTAVGQLPTRCMQVFLDVPFAADVMGAEVSARESRQTARYSARREIADAAVRAHRWQPLRDELTEAERRLASLQAARPDLPARVRQAQEATRALLPLQARASRAQEGLEEARRARIHDQREVRRASESAAARALFAALDPYACPRCEAGIDQRKRLREEQDKQCAVCSSPLEIPEVSDEDRAALLGGLRDRLDASRAAEQTATDIAADAEQALSRATASADHATAAAAHEQGLADYLADLRAAESNVARLKGALEVVASLGQSEAADDTDERIIEAARDILKQVATGATKELFAELNDEILALSHRLGIPNLKSVTLDLAGRINARLSANPKPTAFSALSPGERLRLRVAVVASLIRVGRRRGIRSHPGLLVIDSPTDVEVVAGDAQTLFSELCALGEEEGIQIIIATTNQAVWSALPAESIISGPGRKYLF